MQGKCLETGCQWKSDDFPISRLPVSLSMKFFNRNSARVHVGCHSGGSDVWDENVMDQAVTVPRNLETKLCLSLTQQRQWRLIKGKRRPQQLHTHVFLFACGNHVCNGPPHARHTQGHAVYLAFATRTAAEADCFPSARTCYKFHLLLPTEKKRTKRERKK